MLAVLFGTVVFAGSKVKGVDDYSEQSVDYVCIDDATPASYFSAGHESSAMMKNRIQSIMRLYKFVPSGNKCLQHEGMCVVAQID